MLYSYLHQGSGIGNQLHRYIAVRIKAQELGVDWRMIWNPDNSGKPVGFKADFIEFNHNRVVSHPNLPQWNEKKVVENGIDVRSYDPEWNFVKDNTIIEGEFQDERYWEDYEVELNNWLSVDKMEISEDLCVIGFRGGEFSIYPDLFLTREYYEEAMNLMVEKGVKRFEVHTDDPALAKQFFGDIPVISNPEINWRSMRYADYAIVSNSSFFILPRWLNGGTTIAPRGWGRKNLGIWSMNQNYYKRFQHI